MNRSLLITIDGPAGSGKTTISQLLAERLGYRYIDTGALYRAIALAVKEADIPPTDDVALAHLLPDLDLRVSHGGSEMRISLNGRDVRSEIRRPEISMLASTVSARLPVRRYLLALQQRLGKEKRMVFEGRDMGTVVFPGADIKIFLDADPEERARRRHAQMGGQRCRQSLDQVAREMRARDVQDRSRDLAPLLPAPDALIIDSSTLTIEDVIESILGFIRKACPSQA